MAQKCQVPALKRVVDTVGAGDTFNARCSGKKMSELGPVAQRRPEHASTPEVLAKTLVLWRAGRPAVTVSRPLPSARGIEEMNRVPAMTSARPLRYQASRLKQFSRASSPWGGVRKSALSRVLRQGSAILRSGRTFSYIDQRVTRSKRFVKARVKIG